MRIVGIRRSGGPVEVASLSADGSEVAVLAPLERFWADAPGFLSREPDGGHGAGRRRRGHVRVPPVACRRPGDLHRG
ncbi:hypothetical protein GCM10020220_046600 [Nonomuraea rubra]|uniref:hypothetical protein n=1 Tax=Nonomuraea rubra TaxID=46180 RepID=UPI0031EDEFF4